MKTQHSSAGQSERQNQTEEKIRATKGCYSVMRQLQGGEEVQEEKEIDEVRAKSKDQTGGNNCCKHLTAI